MLGCLMDLLCIDLYCDTVECSPASASISIFMNSHHPIKSTSIVVGSCVWHKAFIQITFHVPFGCATLTMCTCVLACLWNGYSGGCRVFVWRIYAYVEHWNIWIKLSKPWVLIWLFSSKWNRFYHFASKIAFCLLSLLVDGSHYHYNIGKSIGKWVVYTQ